MHERLCNNKKAVNNGLRINMIGCLISCMFYLDKLTHLSEREKKNKNRS
jgi:hypothetical protein